MPETRGRADLVLVRRGFFDSRAKAQAAIGAGLVIADGAPVRKPSDLVADGAVIEASAPHPYVSRGGIKLATALETFAFEPAGRICLDVGASTGGFTDVLLRRGAKRVYAVDVGRGQLHADIASHPAVVALESTDIRSGSTDIPAGAIELAVVDVSFISLRLVLPEMMKYMKNKSQLIALIKPQFEVGRAGIGRGGIVRDAALKETSIGEVRLLVERLGFAEISVTASPITGGDGNEEFLLGASRG